MTDSDGSVRIVHRDEAFLVLDKPAWLATTAPGEEQSLVRIAADLDPSAPHLHPTSRLDSPVSGLVTFARTREANRGLLEARRRGDYARRYVGLAARAPDPRAGACDVPIAIHPQDPHLRCAGPGRGEKAALTVYRTVRAHELGALLVFEPRTGRTHQIRVHAAHLAAPLLGDKHYGGTQRVTQRNGVVIPVRRPMLHCHALRFPTPDGCVLSLSSPIPDDIASVWRALGGDQVDFGGLELERGRSE